MSVCAILVDSERGRSVSSAAKQSGRSRHAASGGNDLIRKIVPATSDATGIGFAITYLDEDEASRPVRRITHAAANRLDLSERAGVAQAVHRRALLDLPLANAGVSTIERAIKLTGAEWQQNFAMNARGTLLPKQVAGRFMPGEAGNGTGCEYGT